MTPAAGHAAVLSDMETEKAGAEAANRYTVSTQAELQALLNRLEAPAEILLNPGNYGVILFRDHRRGAVSISSADQNQPALLSSLIIRNSANITVSHLDFARYEADSTAGNYLFLAHNTDNVHAHHLRFADLNKRVDDKLSSAVMLRDSRSVTFEKSQIQYFRHGITLLDVDRATIQFNEMAYLRTDAIRGGGVNNSVIANNVATEFYPAEGDHPDGIQLWSANQKEPGRNITIRDNLFVKGAGSYVQGIFVSLSPGFYFPFEEVEIANNLLIGTLWHGISVHSANGVKVRDNEVLIHPQQRSWIRVYDSADAVIENNRAPRFLIEKPRGNVREKGNRVGSRSYRNIPSVIREWVASRPSFAAYQGPLLQALMKDAQPE